MDRRLVSNVQRTCTELSSTSTINTEIPSRGAEDRCTAQAMVNLSVFRVNTRDPYIWASGLPTVSIGGALGREEGGLAEANCSAQHNLSDHPRITER